MGDVAHILIKQDNEYTTRLTHYICPNGAQASVLILHGMAEHQNRYQHFAKYLSNAGFDVYTYDHRGHGKDRRIFELGHISADNGYQSIIQDALKIISYIREHSDCKKHFLLGHSMGSLVARALIQIDDAFDGVILTGTTYPSNIKLQAAYILATLNKKVKGPKKLSPYFNNLLFGNKYFTSLTSRTVFDWLSRSNPIVGAYMHDPYCGFICTTAFYQDLISLTLISSKKLLVSKTRTNLPLFILSGEKDPVSCYGKEIKKYLHMLHELGFKAISTKLYPNCRHEILNELNREEVYIGIINWMNQLI